MVNSCNYLHVYECAQFKSPEGCKLRDKCAYKHTAKSADEKENSGTIAVHVIVNVPPGDDEQAVRVLRTGEQEKRRAQVG